MSWLRKLFRGERKPEAQTKPKSPPMPVAKDTPQKGEATVQDREVKVKDQIIITTTDFEEAASHHLSRQTSALKESSHSKRKTDYEQSYHQGWMAGRMSFVRFASLPGSSADVAHVVSQIDPEGVIRKLRALHPDDFRQPGYEDGIRDGMSGKPNKFIPGMMSTI